MLDAIPLTLAVDEEKVIIIVAIIAGGVVLFTVSSLRRLMETRARERTRREVAAYVAEGSMSADDGARLLGSGNEEAEKMIADGVAWGVVKPEKAEGLLRTLRDRGAKA